MAHVTSIARALAVPLAARLPELPATPNHPSPAAEEVAFVAGTGRSAEPSADSESQGALPGGVHFGLLFLIFIQRAFTLSFNPVAPQWSCQN